MSLRAAQLLAAALLIGHGLIGQADNEWCIVAKEFGIWEIYKIVKKT